MVSCGSDGTAVEEPQQRYIIEGVWKYEDEESDHRIKFSYGTVNNYFMSNWLGSVQNGKALSHTKYSDTQGSITYNRIIMVNYRFISEDSLSCYIITTKEQTEDMIFAFKVAKYVKSNAIVVAKDLRTIGICGGQTSRIGALEVAIQRVCDSAKDAVIASDGFMPAVDNIEISALNRISAIIQPGGSIKDNDVTALADKYNIAMIHTGIRHFRH